MTHLKQVCCESFRKWLPFAAIIIIFSGLVYAALQQNYRMSGNDPQIQIAEDISNAITKGKVSPRDIVTAPPTEEIGNSLSAFVAIFSATGTPIGSSVMVDGKLPSLPAGIFDKVKERGENRFTWQPKSGVRIAAVVISFSGPQSGFVLAGRSLKEVEARIKQLTIMTAAATALALVFAYLLILMVVKSCACCHKHGETAEHQH
jgi:hypothetical protein